MTRTILFIAVALLSNVVLGAGCESKSADKAAELKHFVETSPAVDADAVMLGIEYKQNSVAADDRYKGHVLKVDAQYDRVTQRDGEAIVFLHAYHHDYVPGDFVCEWADRADAGHIPSGEIIVRGIGVGEVAGLPRLAMCEASVPTVTSAHAAEPPVDQAPTFQFFQVNLDKFISGLGVKTAKIRYEGYAVTIDSSDCYGVRNAISKLGGLPLGVSVVCTENGKQSWTQKN